MLSDNLIEIFWVAARDVFRLFRKFLRCLFAQFSTSNWPPPLVRRMAGYTITLELATLPVPPDHVVNFKFSVSVISNRFAIISIEGLATATQPQKVFWSDNLHIFSADWHISLIIIGTNEISLVSQRWQRTSVLDVAKRNENTFAVGADVVNKIIRFSWK